MRMNCKLWWTVPFWVSYPRTQFCEASVWFSVSSTSLRKSHPHSSLKVCSDVLFSTNLPFHCTFTETHWHGHPKPCHTEFSTGQTKWWSSPLQHQPPIHALFHSPYSTTLGSYLTKSLLTTESFKGSPSFPSLCWYSATVFHKPHISCYFPFPMRTFKPGSIWFSNFRYHKKLWLPASAKSPVL